MLVWPVGRLLQKALLTEDFLPSVIDANRGRILDVGSMSAYVPPAGLADYAASKSGIVAFREVRDTRSVPNPDVSFTVL